MTLSIAEKIRIILKRQNMTVSDLAKTMKQSRQNLSNKMSRSNFTEQEAAEIAKILGCKFESIFVLKNGDKI
ncbi:MAG: helix-turn-helix transcriptional regulator [Elusimicrobiota bacterium]|jgi:transcriptional regulator with XRE-family HTH domain|nr:helix-turn-helix transcriptional regulator [Elusimicrobiota bacterium]